MGLTAFEAARRVLRVLLKAGFESYLAGGCVRDRLLKVEPADYDVATSARPEQVEALFKRSFGVGRAFGVILVALGKQQVEVATFRSEQGYLDGRHPDAVAFTDARSDVERRDFTINGLLWDPFQDRIIDHVGGLKDLDARLVRAIGDPVQRFQEDGLRLLRAIRFGTLLDFRLEEGTRRALRTQRKRLAKVSSERLHEEFKRIACHPKSRRGDAWRLLVESGLASLVLPFEPGPEESQASARILDSLRARGLSLFLAVPLLEHLTAGEALSSWMPCLEALAGRLRCSKGERELMRRLVGFHPRYRTLKERSLARQRLAACLPDRTLHEDLLQAKGGFKEVLDLLAELRRRHGSKLPPPLVNGRDLLDRGQPRGPRIGWILRRLRVGQLEGRLRTRADALAALECCGH